MSVDVSADGNHSINVPCQFQGYTRHHHERVSCKVDRARGACSEILQEVADLRARAELSNQPGTDPRRTYTFWEGMLETHLGYLLLTLEEQDAAVR